MCFRRVGVLLCFLLLAVPSWSQQVTATSGSAILQQARSALIGTTAIADVTLTGTARRIAGSDDETGSITLQALATGQTQTSFSYPSGPRTETTSISANGVPAGSWTGPDGVAHAMSYHNLLTDSSWFFPALTLSKLLASQATTVTLVSQETNNGAATTHLAATQKFADAPSDIAAQMEHASQMDLFLDAKTLLPALLDFNIHPDDNMVLDIPVEIRFSDYRAVSGVQVPFHVQKYLNNTLILDIQLQTTTLNTGISASAFVAQ